MAQDFSLRYPLIEGYGNFGNIDGDPAAAMRYTEARLTKLAGEMLEELKKETVAFTSTYDGILEEPRVMPARFPNLLVNGSSGIAVGIATNIPPHNLTETIDAAVALIDDPKLDSRGLLKYVKGPDFPTGAQLLASKRELADVYEQGKGALKVRGEWKTEDMGRGKWQIIITSLPYTVNKSALVEKIALLIIEKKLPTLSDVRDESAEDIRVVLEPKSQNMEPEKIMTYLFRHTDLQINFHVNMTALTPASKPLRHSLKQALQSFLDFRREVTEKRLRYDLRLIEERLHILVALAKVYKFLDEAIAIIRKSKTRDEARQGLMSRFKLDEVQANAILDLRLAALVGLEIARINQEKAEKEAEREIILDVLGSASKLSKLVRKELIAIRDEYGDARRTKVIASAEDEHEYSAEDFIEHEDTHVIISRDGWARRMKTAPKPDTLRFKPGDELLSWLPLNTRDTVLFFTSAGKVYGLRALEIQQTTGFGDPVQAMFKFADKERLVAVMGLAQDVTDTPQPVAANDSPATPQRSLFDQVGAEQVRGVFGRIIGQGTELLVYTELGMGFRFMASTLGETTRAGRKVVSLKDDDALLGVTVVNGPLVFALSSDGHGLLMAAEEIAQLSGPGGGVRLIKLKHGAALMAARVVKPKETVTLLYLGGKDDVFKVNDLEKGARGTVGRVVASRRKKLIGLAGG